MAAAPAAAAVWADVLWCLGLGCLLWAVRDGAELLVGRGPVRCFVLDLLAFTAAAVLLVGFSAGVSAAGLARWYMAVGLAAGALAWQKAIVPPLHALAAWIVRLLLAPARWGRRVHCRTAAQSCLRPPGSSEKALLSPPTAGKSGKIKKIWKKPVAKEVEDII